MSNHKRRLLTKGLLLAASLGLTVGMGAGADEPVPAGRAASRLEAADSERYLLLTNGKLLQGVISRDDSTYTLTQKIGVIQFPKKQVERSFDSVQEAYRYLLDRLPGDDPGERLRLARWCLNQHMTAEAKAQLEKILELSPSHGPAKAMLVKISQSEASRASSGAAKVDVDVQQTSGEEVVEDRAGARDAAVLRGAAARMGISGMPVIFDLPQTLAIRRADEFRLNVHPVLQAWCARCHNADYQGAFQLVPATNPRHFSADALRANLDATLRLIDPDNPAKSELLSSTLRPHGVERNKRPIFSGSNNRAYQILATWANGLRAPATAETTAQAGRRDSGEPSEAFAADRNRFGTARLDPLIEGMKSGDPRHLPTIANPAGQAAGGRAYRYLEGQGMVPDDLAHGNPEEFPLPFPLGGARPTAGTSAAGAQAHGQASSPQSALTRGGPSAPRGVGASTTGGETNASAPAGDAAAKARPAASQKTTTPKKKSVKLDPAILEKLLQRNANRPADGN